MTETVLRSGSDKCTSTDRNLYWKGIDFKQVFPGSARAFHKRARYDFVKPLRALVTENEPFSCADTLIQYDIPLCTGAGGAPGPGGGAAIGAIGSEVCGSSIVLAMNMPGTVYSCPLRTEK